MMYVMSLVAQAGIRQGETAPGAEGVKPFETSAVRRFV